MELIALKGMKEKGEKKTKEEEEKRGREGGYLKSLLSFPFHPHFLRFYRARCTQSKEGRKERREIMYLFKDDF